MKSSLMKNWMMILAVSWMVLSAFDASAAEPVTQVPAQLVALIEEGLANNQDIQSMESMVAGFKEEISFAGSLNDPRIGLGLLNLPVDTFAFNQEPMTQKQIFIAQKIPWFGKLSLQSQQAAIKALRQEAILKAKQLELGREIATAYYDLGFVASSQNINARLIDLLTQTLRVSETRYASGQSLQQDVLQAQLELSKLLEEQTTLAKKRRMLEDRINGLLNRDIFFAVTPPQGLSCPSLSLAIEKLQDQALAGNPWLQVRQIEIDQAGVEEKLARKDYWPDVDFIVAYGQRDESKMGQDWSDFVSTSVVMNIPLWQKSRQDKKLSATQLRRKAAAKFHQDLAKKLPHRIDALITDIRSTRKNYELIKGALIIQAKQWARSSLSAYEVGKVEFNTMVSAQIRLLRLENQAENYLFSLYTKHAELEEILGVPLSSSQKDNIRSDS